jgi:hypothetical protein
LEGKVYTCPTVKNWLTHQKSVADLGYVMTILVLF